MNELDAEDAVRAFQLFTGSPSGLAMPAVFLVARGDLKLYTDTYSIPEGYPDEGLVDRHDSLEHMSNREGRRHLRTKLRAALYLESGGFSVSKKSRDTLEYDCFEERIGALDTDVMATSDSGTVALEAGYVEPEYLTRAFGFEKISEGYHEIDTDGRRYLGKRGAITYRIGSDGDEVKKIGHRRSNSEKFTRSEPDDGPESDGGIDPISRLKSRYVNGEISLVKFEREIETSFAE